MAIYDLRCADGHRFEVVQSFSDALPACPSCGAATAKIPASFGIAGAAGATRRLPPTAEQMPQTWRGTYNGNREYVTSLRRTAEARQRLEEKHPELAPDKRPIIAHEGRFEGAPLRAGDPIPKTAGPNSSGGQSHGHGHGHTHSHGAPPT